MAIRNMVTSYEYAPGEKINILQTATALNMSSTPIREALSRLAHDNFIENRVQKGFYMKPPNAAELREVLELIHMFSHFIFRQIVSVNNLESLSYAITQTFGISSPTETARALEPLGRTITELASCPNAERQYEQLLVRTKILRFVEFSDPDRHAALKQIAFDVAGHAREGREAACLRGVDAYYAHRLGWFDKVIETTALTIQHMHDTPKQEICRD